MDESRRRFFGVLGKAALGAAVTPTVAKAMVDSPALVSPLLSAPPKLEDAGRLNPTAYVTISCCATPQTVGERMRITEEEVEEEMMDHYQFGDRQQS